MHRDPDWDEIRHLLLRLGSHLQEDLLRLRATTSADELASVAVVTAADTIYRVDLEGEESILRWLAVHWPARWPVEVIMEGLEDRGPITFPSGTSLANTRVKLIIDPIDGTRALIYDKRSAWALMAAAPQLGPGTSLADLRVACMTELPSTKARFADQFSAIRGAGVSGVGAQRLDLVTGTKTAWVPQPSRAADFRGGYAGAVRFFPEGKACTAALEERLWDILYGLGRQATPLVFEDQYPSTGGQIHELLVGHDRMVADLRPIVFERLGLKLPLCCHPYDICTALVLEEAGGVVRHPLGGPLRTPLDTTSPVAWIGYANPALADLAEPVWQRILSEWDWPLRPATPGV